MIDTINKLEQLIKLGVAYCAQSSEQEMSRKESPDKWSKKEILGHLIDSGINNLQRFTEIQFENKPYNIRKYNQNELVKANDYQNSDLTEIVEFWSSINHRIKNLMAQQTDNTLNYKIELEKGNFSDLRFLMNDYVVHLEHHLKQIIQ